MFCIAPFSCWTLTLFHWKLPHDFFGEKGASTFYMEVPLVLSVKQFVSWVCSIEARGIYENDMNSLLQGMAWLLLIFILEWCKLQWNWFTERKWTLYSHFSAVICKIYVIRDKIYWQHVSAHKSLLYNTNLSCFPTCCKFILCMPTITICTCLGI